MYLPEVSVSSTMDIERQVNEYISNAREEDKYKEWRKNNLIFNVDESRKETQTAKNEDDEAKCRRIFVEVGVEDCTVGRMFRLGRSSDNGKHRPLLVKLSTEKEKWTIMSRTKRQRTPLGRLVRSTYLNRDMSREERARDNELRTMLAEKRMSGEMSWKIRRGRLINDIAKVEETEERMAQPRSEEGDMRTGARPKEGDFGGRIQ